MFRRFAHVISQLPGIPNHKIDNDYADEKLAAEGYQVYETINYNLYSPFIFRLKLKLFLYFYILF
jgi:hypothetical protein